MFFVKVSFPAFTVQTNFFLKDNSFFIDRLLFKKKDMYLFTKKASFSFEEKKLNIYILDLVTVLIDRKNKPSNVPDFNLSLYNKVLKHINLRLLNFTLYSVDIPSKTAFSFILPNAFIKKGLIYNTIFSKFTYMNGKTYQDVYVLVPKAFIKDGTFYADYVKVLGNYFYFIGYMKWKHRNGKILTYGNILPIKTSLFETSPLYVNAIGYIDNKLITFNAHGLWNFLKIKNMKDIKPIEAFVKGYVEGDTFFSGIIKSPVLESYVSYNSKKDVFKLKIKSLKLGSSYIDKNIPFFLNSFGTVDYYPSLEKVNLNIKTNDFFIYNKRFYGGYLKGELVFNKDKIGNLKLSLYKDGELLNGTFSLYKEKGIFTGYVSNFLVNHKNISFLTNSNLELSLYPKLYFESFGYINNLKLPFSTNLSSIPYSLSYKEGNLIFSSLSNKAKIYASYLDKSLQVSIEPKDLTVEKRFNEKPINIVLKGGTLKLIKKGNLYPISILNLEALLKYNAINLSSTINGNLVYDGGVSGNINLVSSILSPSKLKNALIKGNININKNVYTFALNGSYNNIFANLNGSYNNGLYLKASIFSKYLKNPVYVDAIYTNNKKSIDVKPLSYTKDFYSFYFSGLSTKGFNKNLLVEYSDGASFKVFGENILKVSPFYIYITLKPFEIKTNQINMNGMLNGILRASYEKSSNNKYELNLEGSGKINVLRSLSFIKSKLPFVIDKDIMYYFRFKNRNLLFKAYNNQDLHLMSRFIPKPLLANINFVIYNKELGGFLDLYDSKGIYLKTILSSKDDTLNLNTYISNLPFFYKRGNISFQGFLKGRISTSFDIKKLYTNIKGEVGLQGNVNVKKLGGQSAPMPKLKNVALDIKLNSLAPLTISLPEGFLFGNLSGTLFTKDDYLFYNFSIDSKSGELYYFGKKFYVRKLNIYFKPNSNIVDLNFVNVGPNYNTYINAKGDIDNPNVFIYSEPPVPQSQLLSQFLLQNSQATALPINYFLSLSSKNKISPSSIISNILGTNINVSVMPQATSNNGITPIIEAKKNISDKISLEAHISPSSNPQNTYYGASMSLTPNISINAKIYGNNSQEANILYKKSFDIK